MSQRQQALQVLIACRQLLDKPESWRKKGLAWNEDGRKVAYSHPRACTFSLDGALHRIRHITHTPAGPAHDTLLLILSREKLIPLYAFNDAVGTTHTAVLDLLDKGIRRLGGEPPPRFIEEDN